MNLVDREMFMEKVREVLEVRESVSISAQGKLLLIEPPDAEEFAVRVKNVERFSSRKAGTQTLSLSDLVEQLAAELVDRDRFEFDGEKITICPAHTPEIRYTLELVSFS